MSLYLTQEENMKTSALERCVEKVVEMELYSTYRSEQRVELIKQARAELAALKAGGGSLDGVCCQCRYAGSEETQCSKREDGLHCEHWYNGRTDNRERLADAKARFASLGLITEPNVTAWNEALNLIEELVAVPPERLSAPAPQISTRMQGVDCPECEDGTSHTHTALQVDAPSSEPSELSCAAPLDGLAQIKIEQQYATISELRRLLLLADRLTELIEIANRESTRAYGIPKPDNWINILTAVRFYEAVRKAAE